jgi:hypothetical protein
MELRSVNVAALAGAAVILSGAGAAAAATAGAGAGTRAQPAPGNATTGPPTVALKAVPVPIPGFPHTGNLYGAGAGIRAEIAIAGSEYAGSPPPLASLALDLPDHTKIHSSGFPTCPPEAIEPNSGGPSVCPRGSVAGPPGTASASVSTGRERAPEALTEEAWNRAGGGLTIRLHGSAPTAVDLLAEAPWLFLTGHEGFGPQLDAALPVVLTVPEAPAVSIDTLQLGFGTAFKSHGKPTYYVSLPRFGQCPKGGLVFRAQLGFAAVGALAPQTVIATYRSPCPRARVGDRPHPGNQAPPPAPQVVPPPAPAPAAPPAPCVSKRHFTIHVAHARGVAYREVSVFLNGRRVKVARGPQVSAAIDLRGLPQGTYTVRIVAVTTAGRTVTSTRTYRTCVTQVARARRRGA